MTSSSLFALALAQIDGVGRVTAGRLLKHFADYDDLRRYPREQVLLRIKGAPNAETLVRRLCDTDTMRERLEAARDTAGQLEEQHVQLLTPRDADWPPGLSDLPRGERPFLLYAFGHREALQIPTAALFARPPLSNAPFEAAQALVRALLRRGLLPATGAAHGFDVVVHKLAGGASAPSLLVANAGLSRVTRSVRPAASGAVRAGGLMLSPFPMRHGPFDHDDYHRALVLAALAGACIFVEPRPDTPEHRALAWALDAGRPTFGWPAPGSPLPDGAVSVESKADFDKIIASASGSIPRIEDRG